MNTVTIDAAAPAAAMAPAKTADGTITDSAGRLLVVREPSILDESRLVRALGDAAANQAYMMGYALPACMVCQIDDDKLPFPTSQAMVDAAVKRLDRHGIAAVMAHVTGLAQLQEAATATPKA